MKGSELFEFLTTAIVMLPCQMMRFMWRNECESGGKQQVSRDGWWGGKPVDELFLGHSKGNETRFGEEGKWHSRYESWWYACCPWKSSRFKNEKSSIEHFLKNERGNIVYMLPKFHCEVNTVKLVWSQPKRYTKINCKYSIASLRKLIIPTLETVTLENIQNYFRKVW